MSDLKQEQYLNKIISLLKDLQKEEIPKLPDIELEECEINISGENLFKDLYNNLQLYYKLNKKANILINEKKYIFSALVDILSIIYESNPNCFYNNNKLKIALIYLINILKDSTIINMEIACKIIFNLEYQIKNIINEKIDKEVLEFENKVFQTLKICLDKYIQDFEVEIKNYNDLNNFEKMMKCLKTMEEENLPFHLKGFIEYDKMENQKKLLIIKIYEYMKKINPYKDEENNNNFHLYQGYSLYEILFEVKKKISTVNLEEFNRIRDNRIKNKYAKTILELSIKLLKAKSDEELKKILNKENLDFKAEYPKISCNFDNTEEYYRDIYEQLIYYLIGYKDSTSKKFCQIIYDKFYKFLWLNFNKILLINLSENDIKDNKIKIIFYFIVNLFSPDLDYETSLELRDDTIPALFNQCDITNYILKDQYIFQILDKKYSQYYSNPDLEKKFDQMVINLINKNILKNKKVEKLLETDCPKSFELRHILNCADYLPFPIIKQYLEEDGNIINIKNNILSNFYLYRNCFCDLDNSEQEDFIKKLMDINFEPNDYYKKDEICEIINDKDFLNLINKIMTSRVMNHVYYIINKFYSKNGKIDIEEEIKIIINKENIDLYDEEKTTINNAKNNKNIKGNKENNEIKINEKKEEEEQTIYNQQYNFINNKPIISYYNEFCKELKKIDYSNIFIIMSLPSTIKGFTFRFLKIVLNCEGIKLNSIHRQKNNILLKGYFIFVIIHEQNHFIKRYFNKNVKNNLCNTPKINNYNEGGKHLIKILFGDEMINKNLNLEQAEYILNIDNWTQKSLYQFREDFLKIKTNGKESIIYLNSDYSSICDHSKLHI